MAVRSGAREQRRPGKGERSEMSPRTVDRVRLEREVTTARRRALELVPFSPSWDAAMGLVEDLQRALWLLDSMSGGGDQLDAVDRSLDPILA